MKLLLLTAASLAVITALPPVNHAAQSDTEDEEYQVYSTVIRSLPIDLPRAC